MLGLPPSVQIHFATALVDMRNGIDGLRRMVEGTLKKDPYEGHLFVFVGKAKHKIKILFWDAIAIDRSNRSMWSPGLVPTTFDIDVAPRVVRIEGLAGGRACCSSTK
jgi:hypothetical protein